jgi:hypothetical protein
MGADIVGGIPHFERTMEEGRASVEALCRLAADRGLPVDMHCDESDDPLSRHVETLAAQTLRFGLQGRVTGSHLTSMHSMDNYYVSKLIPLMVEAQMNVIPNPLINIMLQGRHDSYPKRRGMTRVRELMAAGLTDIPQVARRLMANSPYLAAGSSVFSPSLVCARRNAPMWVDRAAMLCQLGRTNTFFSAADKLALPLSFGLGQFQLQAHDGGARNRRMAARMARTIGPVTATSASWKVMARAWRTTRAPILINLSCKLVNDQSAMASGSSMQRKKVAML